ncbi:MAG: heat-inducible transcriptional repressor HrcA [Limnochordia bacterium]|nr:heat-inducible transcriptional repressor HrcA [Limnochordia bacterium]
MDDRKRRILEAITDDYIFTAEPVGSRTIARRHNLGVSAATIRNEMSDLEEHGFLHQPHTSAGRIPSDKGYRFYVDVLMEPDLIELAERIRIKREINAKRREIEDAISYATRLLAVLTQYTSIALAPSLSMSRFRHVRIVPLEEKNVMVISVIDPGFVQNKILESSEPISEQSANHMSDYLSHLLRTLTINDLTKGVINELRNVIQDAMLFQDFMELLVAGLDSRPQERIYLDGATNLLEQPEFKDVEKARTLLRVLEGRHVIFDLLDPANVTGGLRVIIGSEHKYEELQSCSIVMATYHIKGEVFGSMGVLGPTRMNYRRTLSLVQFMAESLSETLTNITR